MIVSWLWACAGPAAVAPPPPPPPQVDAPAVADEPVAPPPPTGWRTGWQPGPPLVHSPVEKWSRTLGGPITEPITTDGERLYVVAQETVHCLDYAGTLLWKMRLDPTGPVAMTDLGPVVGTSAARVLVLDPKNGATVRSMIAAGPPRGAVVPLATSVAWATVHGAVASTANWGQDVGLSAAGGPAADGDTVYLATLEGQLIAADAGGVRWKVSLPGPAIEGPTLDATGIYVPIAARDGQPGGVVALDRAGVERWRKQTRFQPAAALALGRHLLVPDKDGRLYAFDTATGDEGWSVEGFGEFSVQPAVVGDHVYAGNGDGTLYRIDGFDGGVVWTHALGAAITGEPVVARGLLVVGLANGRLVALEEGS